MPVVDHQGHLRAALVDLVDQRGKHVALGLVSVFLQQLTQFGGQRGVTVRDGLDQV